MSIDLIFHYPPELINLLVDTIPLLNRGKKDVFLFFKGAGVPEHMMVKTRSQWERDKDSISKYDIARDVLTKLNERGDECLQQRREVLKRVVEFDSFSACWDADRLKAKGLVGDIQKVVNVKDSFTRMSMERETERKEKVERTKTEIAATQMRKAELVGIKKSLFALFSETDVRKRGMDLEGVLNRLFKAYGVLVREAFTLRGAKGEGTVEQIDGVIEFDSHLYFVEMKWLNKALGKPEVGEHLVRVFGRAEARAIIISASGFTKPGIVVCEEALRDKVIILCTLQEIVTLLEGEQDLVALLRKKVHSAMVEKRPFLEILPGTST